MKIGITAPISVDRFSRHLFNAPQLPRAEGFPFTAELVEQWLGTGKLVHVFALEPRFFSNAAILCRAPAKLFEGPALAVTMVPMRRRTVPRMLDGFYTEIRGLSEAIQIADVDVVHAHWTYEFAWAAQNAGKPTVVTAHDDPISVLRMMPTPYRLYRLLMAKRVLARAPFLTTVSPYMQDALRRFCSRTDVRVVPNGVDGTSLVSPEFRSKMSVPSDFICVSQWGPRKNVKVLLAAFREVRRRLHDARLLLVGGGCENNGPAMQWAARERCTEGVEFLGAMSNPAVTTLLRQPYVAFVNPSLWESFSMVTLEAMAAGLPIVAGKNSGAIAWLLDEGRCGTLVDVREAQELASAMLALNDNRSAAVSLGQRATERVRAHFTLEQVAAEYERCFEQAIALGRGGAKPC